MNSEKLDLLERWEQLCDEVPMSDEEADAVLQAAGIDVAAAYTRLQARISKERTTRYREWSIARAGHWQHCTLCTETIHPSQVVYHNEPYMVHIACGVAADKKMEGS